VTREEVRVQGQAEPISHFTDAVRAGDLLFVSGIVAVDGDGRLVGGDDVVAQTRQVFENMRAVLAAGGCGFEDVVKATIFLTVDQPGAPGDLRLDAARVHARRGAAARGRGREGRDRVRRARPELRVRRRRASVRHRDPFAQVTSCNLRASARPDPALTPGPAPRPGGGACAFRASYKL
jgi:enamine deaminase RidA (YjgF/YER057c/UK114 family)